jgi:hypothetical protein
VGKEPEQIRDEIEETRVRMGETVEALGYKADVKSRVKDSIADKKDAVVSKVTGAVPDTEGVKHGARRGVGIAKENPLGLVIGGAAAGFLIGLLLPSTRLEDERLGEIGDQVRETVKDSGKEALDRGKGVVQEVSGTAAETARESGQEQAQELAASVKDGVQGP